jgi:hypothetical protein
MLKTVQQEWEGFAKMVIPELSVTDIQHVEMKKAFFAGAYSMIMAVKAIGSPEIRDDIALQYLADRQVELETYYRNLIKDYSETN